MIKPFDFNFPIILSLRNVDSLQDTLAVIWITYCKAVNDTWANNARALADESRRVIEGGEKM